MGIASALTEEPPNCEMTNQMTMRTTAARMKARRIASVRRLAGDPEESLSARVTSSQDSVEGWAPRDGWLGFGSDAAGAAGAEGSL